MKNKSSALVDTKHQLENLVVKFNEYNKRSIRLLEAEGAPAPNAGAASVSTPTSTPSQSVPTNNVSQAGSLKDQSTEETPESTPKDGGIPTMSAIIDQLNTVRAGRSTKDPEVKQEFQRYFDGLDDSEKEALYAYLKGIAQIVSGQVDAGSAEEPKNHGVATTTTGIRTRTVKPNIIKNSPKKNTSVTPAQTSNSSVENTAPPAPIVPKKR
jgi:hypothetical protein